MAYAPISSLIQGFYDSNGAPLAGGTLYAYEAGTTTPITLYSDSSGTELGVSVSLNSAGYPSSGGAITQVWLDDSATYKFVLKDASEVTIWTLDNVAVPGTAGSSVRTASTLVALRAVTGGGAVFLSGRDSAGDGGGGEFVWRTGNQSAKVTSDPESGVWVAPDSDPTGASGAWQRQYSMWHVDPRWFGAKIDGATTDNTAMQAAMDFSLSIALPPDSVMRIDPSDPLIVRQGHHIRGWGQDSSVIYPTATGGTIFKRVAPATDNSYVRNVVFDGIAVVFNHPTTADPVNYYQIAFDLRSISRAIVRNCYAGNYSRGPLRDTRTDPANQSDAVQGYGAICGTESSGSADYCGGEVPTIELSQFYGCRKAVVIDDASLSPLSACYGANIRDNDVQICESGIAIEQQYNAGSNIVGNVVQAVQNMRGSTETTYAYRLAGRECYLYNRYVEVATGDCDYILRCDSTAKRNYCLMGLIGNDDTYIPLISDAGGWGNHNRIGYNQPSTNEFVWLDGGVDSELGRDKARVIFDSTGAEQGTSMRVASISKNGTGDWTVAWDTNTFADANYTYSIDGQVNTSGTGGFATVRTQAANSLRIVTRDDAGTPTDWLRTVIRAG